MDWLIKRSVVAYKGTVDFILCTFATTSSGEVTPEWNSTLGQGMVLECLETSEIDIGKESVDELSKILYETITARDAAAKSAADADRTANSINESATQIAANKEAVGQLKEDVQTLSNDGRINIEGTDHNYYFGGGPNYSDLAISNLTFTKVFPIEPEKTYHVISSGNMCTIGFANEEYTEGGKLSGNVVKSEQIFDFTNDGKYAFLYVHYSTGNKEKQGDCLLEVYTNIVLKELLYKKQQKITIY